MDTCRTCLKTPADRDISQLERVIKDDQRKCIDIMEFCLDIKVIQNSKITTRLCNNCYRKIISFYKFKDSSLKNDAYLRSLDPATQLVHQKPSVYVDENGVKHENLLETDEYGPSLVECGREIKIEINFKHEDILGDEGISFDELDSTEVGTLENEQRVISGNEQIHIKDEETLGGKKLNEKPICTVQKPKDEEINDKKTKDNVRVKRCRPKKEKSIKKEKWKPERQICDECGKSFLNLKEHMLQHRPKEERQKLQCKACPKTFFSIRGHKNHYQIKHLGIKFKCDICDKVVTDLKAHKMKVHDRDNLPYGCVQCDRRYIARSMLDMHMVTHTKDTPYECDVCQKRFGFKNTLVKHIRQVHDKIKSYHCQYCSKAFFKSERLQAHTVRLHTNDRPYECEKCGKAFAVADYLKKHLATHGAKNYPCQRCDMSFVKHSNLRAHMVSHTKEKRYPCGFCGVRFGRSDHRNRHQLTAHKKLKSAD